MMSNTGAAVGGAFDFDCDCGAWGTDDDFGSEFPFRPPHFDLPPPPLPPSLQPPPELCSSESFATAIAEETCQAFLVNYYYSICFSLLVQQSAEIVNEGINAQYACQLVFHERWEEDGRQASLKLDFLSLSYLLCNTTLCLMNISRRLLPVDTPSSSFLPTQ